MIYDSKQLRHELKFYLHPHEYASLKIRVNSILQLDRNSVDSDGYHIRSLYFDTMHDDALFEKNFGVMKRKKYRIRIYNKSEQWIKLERKSRFGDYICKEAASLSRAEYERIMKGDVEFLLERNSPLLKQFYYGITVHGLRPKVIVDYVREAYLYRLGDVRVTFDKGLSTVINSLDIFDANAAPVRVFRQPMEILEVKYTEFLPVFVKELLDIRASVRSAISKYVLCREFMKDHHHL